MKKTLEIVLTSVLIASPAAAVTAVDAPLPGPGGAVTIVDVRKLMSAQMEHIDRFPDTMWNYERDALNPGAPIAAQVMLSMVVDPLFPALKPEDSLYQGLVIQWGAQNVKEAQELANRFQDDPGMVSTIDRMEKTAIPLEILAKPVESWSAFHEIFSGARHEPAASAPEAVPQNSDSQEVRSIVIDARSIHEKSGWRVDGGHGDEAFSWRLARGFARAGFKGPITVLFSGGRSSSLRPSAAMVKGSVKYIELARGEEFGPADLWVTPAATPLMLTAGRPEMASGEQGRTVRVLLPLVEDDYYGRMWSGSKAVGHVRIAGQSAPIETLRRPLPGQKPEMYADYYRAYAKADTIAKELLATARLVREAAAGGWSLDAALAEHAKNNEYVKATPLEVRKQPAPAPGVSSAKLKADNGYQQHLRKKARSLERLMVLSLVVFFLSLVGAIAASVAAAPTQILIVPALFLALVSGWAGILSVPERLRATERTLGEASVASVQPVAENESNIGTAATIALIEAGVWTSLFAFMGIANPDGINWLGVGFGLLASLTTFIAMWESPRP
ncbi:MAG: hypothetical protein HY077_02685 [Elusimicrobia bacterium]|nr:hypothetical protein [Elusimicrobiota bacterium]